MHNKTLIIAGMHRSGTSLITQWLNKCGLELGENMLGPNTGNDEGHFEDIEFLRLHEEILSDNHLPANGLTQEHNICISPYHREKLKGVIKIKNKLYKQWGWKDPRTCLFLDTYKELLPDARYLIVIRDYRAVVSSLLKRDFKNIDINYATHKNFFSQMAWKYLRRKRELKKYYNKKAEHYLKVWIAYNEELLKSVKNLPNDSYLVLNYSVLNSEDAKVCQYLKDHWQLSLKYFNFNKVYKQTMMNDPIDTDSFIENKSLITRALQLENMLNNYMALD